ncbi:MAG: hypothetical protein ACR2M1_01345 [Gemmatimonadaceae bacterium]
MLDIDTHRQPYRNTLPLESIMPTSIPFDSSNGDALQFAPGALLFGPTPESFFSEAAKRLADVLWVPDVAGHRLGGKALYAITADVKEVRRALTKRAPISPAAEGLCQAPNLTLSSIALSLHNELRRLYSTPEIAYLLA